MVTVIGDKEQNKCFISVYIADQWCKGNKKFGALNRANIISQGMK